MNDQIPWACALNVAIINEALATNDLNRARVEVPLKYNITPPQEGQPWPIVNMSWYAYMLYCLLVAPKEQYENITNDDPIYQHYISTHVMRHFTMHREINAFTEDPKYHFRALRNSISHLNYNMNTDNILHMWDHPPRKSKIEHWHWEATISSKNLHDFLGEVADSTMRIYNEVRNGTRNADGTLA